MDIAQLVSSYSCFNTLNMSLFEPKHARSINQVCTLLLQVCLDPRHKLRDSCVDRGPFSGTSTISVRDDSKLNHHTIWSTLKERPTTVSRTHVSTLFSGTKLGFIVNLFASVGPMTMTEWLNRYVSLLKDRCLNVGFLKDNKVLSAQSAKLRICANSCQLGQES